MISFNTKLVFSKPEKDDDFGKVVAAKTVTFSLHDNDDSTDQSWPVRMAVDSDGGFDSASVEPSSSSAHLGSSRGVSVVSPGPGPANRPAFHTLPITALNPELHGLLKSQFKFFEASSNAQLIETSMKTTLGPVAKRAFCGTSAVSEGALFDFYDALFNFDTDVDSPRGRRRRGVGGVSANTRKAHSIGAASKHASGRLAAGQAASAAADSDTMGTEGGTRRSRSTGATLVRQNSRGRSLERNPGDAPAEGDNEQEDAEDEEQGEPTPEFPVYRTLSTDVLTIASRYKGPVNGIWLTNHPLTLNPASYSATMQIISEEDSLSAHKKAEWVLDCIREFDEKRIECIEEHLVQIRANVDIQLQSIAKNDGASKVKKQREEDRINGRQLEYYRDKGRQPRGSRTFATFL